MGDSVLKDIVKQAISEIVIPKTLNIVNTMFTECVYMVGDAMVKGFGEYLFGKDNAPANPRITRKDSPEKYSSISRRNYPPLRDNIGSRQSTDLEYVCFKDHDVAVSVKNELVNMIYRYSKVRVSDLYEMTHRRDKITNELFAIQEVRIAPNDYNFGWTRASDIKFSPDRNGFVFDLPRPVRL